jgi:hypothetical protein
MFGSFLKNSSGHNDTKTVHDHRAAFMPELLLPSQDHHGSECTACTCDNAANLLALLAVLPVD